MIIREAVKLLKHLIPTTIKIEQDIDSNCKKILSDSTQLHQIIMNLAINASHAMEKNGGVLKFTLAQEELHSNELGFELDPGTYVKFSVSDTGHGIEEGTLKKIFDPYFTTKEQGKGTGMGLAMIYGIVRDYNGMIDVTSTIGKGTVFDLYFPVVH